MMTFYTSTKLLILDFVDLSFWAIHLQMPQTPPYLQI